MKDKVSQILRMSLIKFVKLNFFSKQIERKRGCYIIPYRHSLVKIAKNAKIKLNANLYLNENKFKGSRAECYLELKDNSCLTVEGNSTVNCQSRIQIFECAEIILRGAYINGEVNIMCSDKIDIGSGVLIARGTYIYDGDFHDILNDDGEKINKSKPIFIGDNVWIGIRSLILKGAKIEKGVVVAANSTVSKRVKSGLLVSGNPARAFMEVKWRI
jgi:acetyltransferase-like isoleucine patch superfamily enzyme